jgi:hypothetical protein
MAFISGRLIHHVLFWLNPLLDDLKISGREALSQLAKLADEQLQAVDRALRRISMPESGAEESR